MSWFSSQKKGVELPKYAWMGLDIFADMTPDGFSELLESLEQMTFSAGEVLLREGDKGDALFLLERGAVEVQAKNPDGSGEGFVSTLRGPCIFGEMALVTDNPRSATIVASTDVECFRLSRKGYEATVARESGLSHFVTRVVGERLLEADNIRQVGKYEITGRLGAGAGATVFSARHPELEVEVALKMLNHSLVHRPGFAGRFKDEARRVANLNHEHIVRVYDTQAGYGTHFIVMELLRGTLLEDILESRTRLAWGAIRRILKEICKALHYSHETGLLHRDIKPSNVFLTEDRRVKIMDFGIAVATRSSGDDGGLLLGTPYYMSPEQIRGEPLDGRTDLYSLGIVAYELVTGDVPYEATTLDELLLHQQHTPVPDPRESVTSVPEDLVEFIARATAKKASDRYDDCAQAAAFLQTASELPLVHRLELSTVAISYHPSLRQRVKDALEELNQNLEATPGVSILWGHQESTQDDQEKLLR